VIVQDQLLNSVLGSVRISTVHLGRVELFAPWGAAVSSESDLLLHYLLEGNAWAKSHKGETFHFTAGDVVLAPSHFTHALCDSLETPISNSNFWQATENETFGVSSVRRRFGGDGARTVILCAAIDLAGASKRLLLDAIPDVIHLQGRQRDAIPNFTATLELIRDEVRQGRAAAELMLARYVELLVLGVLRAAPRSDRPSWLSATHETNLAHALAAIHGRPRAPWSVSTLAKEAGMSRSAFAARFTESVGEGPIRYLTRWRLALARELLESDASSSVETIAANVGYANAAAFSTAFRREFGMSPGNSRRRNPRAIDARR
jgi:AraC family transcriptional regulator, activator of mtrCDE